MHAGAVRHLIECQVVVLAPVCPHTCDHVWRNLLGAPTSVFQARWPDVPPPREDIIHEK